MRSLMVAILGAVLILTASAQNDYEENEEDYYAYESSTENFGGDAQNNAAENSNEESSSSTDDSVTSDSEPNDSESDTSSSSTNSVIRNKKYAYDRSYRDTNSGDYVYRPSPQQASENSFTNNLKTSSSLKKKNTYWDYYYPKSYDDNGKKLREKDNEGTKYITRQNSNPASSLFSSPGGDNSDNMGMYNRGNNGRRRKNNKNFYKVPYESKQRSISFDQWGRRQKSGIDNTYFDNKGRKLSYNAKERTRRHNKGEETENTNHRGYESSRRNSYPHTRIASNHNTRYNEHGQDLNNQRTSPKNHRRDLHDHTVQNGRFNKNFGREDKLGGFGVNKQNTPGGRNKKRASNLPVGYLNHRPC